MDILRISYNIAGQELTAHLPLEPGKILAIDSAGKPTLIESPLDADGALKIGADARILPVAGGFKVQVRPGAGSEWQEADTTVANP